MNFLNMIGGQDSRVKEESPLCPPVHKSNKVEHVCFPQHATQW